MQPFAKEVHSTMNGGGSYSEGTTEYSWSPNPKTWNVVNGCTPCTVHWRAMYVANSPWPITPTLWYTEYSTPLLGPYYSP